MLDSAAILIAVGIGLVLVLLVLGVAVSSALRRKKALQEARVTAMMDQMSMRRASVDSKYLEKDLFPVVEQTVLAQYAQDPNKLPAHQLKPELYGVLYQNMKREYELGVRKTVNQFQMLQARVVKQDNSNMFSVTSIEIEAQFAIEYQYVHPTSQKWIAKEFTQRFVFLNTNNAWLLEKILPESSVKASEQDFSA